MQTANFDLCEQLLKASGWKGTPFVYDISYADRWLRYIADFPEDSREKRGIQVVPAYDLSYLLHKLPEGYTIVTRFNTGWLASWAEKADADDYAVEASTPEDAVSLLAIALFEQNILEKDDSNG